MASAWVRRAALAGALLSCACGGNGATPGTTGDGGADGSAPITLTFVVPEGSKCAHGGLCASPSQAITLGIDSSTDTGVTLALEGGYGDASLTTDTVTTAGGQGSVTVVTSTTATTFQIVARAGAGLAAPQATLAVTVGASGVAIVRATPVYTGTRAAPGFFATSVQVATCAAANGSLPPDASWLPAATLAVPFILPVTANEPVAVAVRISHYATGCAEIPPLGASVTDDVSIDVYDVPIALVLTDMNATFTFDSGALTPVLTTAASDVGGAFFGSSSDGTALLQAIRAQVDAADLAQFDAARTAGGWDVDTTSWLTTHGPSMHDQAAALLQDAVNDLGTLVLHLGAGPLVGTATVTPVTLSGVSANLAGIAAPPAFTWTAAADDTVHLAGTITVSTSPYIAHAADALAAQMEAGTTTVPSAIAAVIDCAGLAAKLVGTGDAYGTCDASCFGEVCAQAVAAAWQTALTSPSNGSDAMSLALDVGATASVGDDAEPLYFQGGWVGEVSGPVVSTAYSAQGTVVGVEPTTP